MTLDERRDDKQDVWSACERQDGQRVVDKGIVLAYESQCYNRHCEPFLDGVAIQFLEQKNSERRAGEAEASQSTRAQSGENRAKRSLAVWQAFGDGW